MDQKIIDITNSSNFNKERIFPILNKLDRIWSTNENLQFCDIVKLLKLDSVKTDLELTIALDLFIDGNNIK